MNIIRSVCYLLLVSIAQGQHLEPSMSIVPELTHLGLLEGTSLNLECTYSRPVDSSAQSIDFYLNGQIIQPINNMGFLLSSTSQTNLSLESSTLTLKKNVTSNTDSGAYVCKTNDSLKESRIDVLIFQVSVQGDTLRDKATSLILQCQPQGLNATDTVQIDWSRGGQKITTGSKYNVHSDNNTLEILHPVRADMGEYSCEVVFNSGTVEEQRVALEPVAVKAIASLDSHSSGKIIMEGEPLELWCQVSGYPLPTVEWSKDNKALNTSNRINIQEYEGCPTCKLTISKLEIEDKGIYTCEFNTHEVGAAASMIIRVIADTSTGNKIYGNGILNLVLIVLATFSRIGHL